MIVILASQWDPSAQALAARWAAFGAELLTPRDLSLPGWRQSSGPVGAIAVVGGKPVPVREITAVLTRVHCVDPRELLHIVPEDRDYVASEMTAFLLFWLSRLTCPVWNPPTPPFLAGPFWRREKWVHLASQADISARPVRRFITMQTPPTENTPEAFATILTVVGQRTFGDADPALHRTALRIAALGHADLLSVTFSGPRHDAQFIDANIFPDLADAQLADAVIEHLSASQAPHK